MLSILPINVFVAIVASIVVSFVAITFVIFVAMPFVANSDLHG
jgi:hypothetical protein